MAPLEAKTHCKYVVKKAGQIVHGGITRDFKRKALELRQAYGPTAKIRQIGQIVTEKSAHSWKEKYGYE